MTFHFELPIQQLSSINCQLSFSTAILLLSLSLITAEVRAYTGPYDAAKAVTEISHNLHRVCDKYDDELRYEYDNLYVFPGDTVGIYQMRPIPKHKDFMNKWFSCVTGQWDVPYVVDFRQRTYDFNYERERHAKMDFKYNRNMTETEQQELHKKEFKKIIFAEHPFVRLIDEYHHIFVMQKYSDESGWDGVEHPFKPMITEVYNTWMKHRKDKFVKEKGENYFETSNHPLTFTFRQFVKFLTLITSETMEGKRLVSDMGNFEKRWEPLWKKCTPCVKGFRYDYVVDVAHMEQDMKYVLKELDIPNLTDAEPLKVKPYPLPESLKRYQSINEEKDLTPVLPFGGIAKDHEKIVKKFYSTLYKAEILDLYRKYRLDLELFGFTPDKFIAYGMEDETSQKPVENFYDY